jgi:hypothetical protein
MYSLAKQCRFLLPSRPRMFFPALSRRFVPNHRLSKAKRHPMDSETLTLWCWIYGDHFKQIFPIEISNTKTVADLRNAIKIENSSTLSNVEARALLLYKVSLAYYNECMEEPSNDDMKEPLYPELRLSRVFSHPPLEYHIHIVVRLALLPSESHSNLVSCGVSDGASLMT